MARLLCGALAGSRLLSAAFADTMLSLSLSDTPPSNASAFVDSSYAGFGIEPSNLFQFMGYAEANEISLNLIANLGNYTGSPPHIRLGGNTQDYMIYSESQDGWNIQINPKPTGQGNIASDSMLIGPRYFEAANRLPKNTPVTWGLNLAYEENDYADQIATMAHQVLDRCTNLDITSFEIGNEPDVYTENGFRNDSWSGTEYAPQWAARAKAVYEQVLSQKGLPSNFFDLAATTAWVTGTTFEIEKLDSSSDQIGNYISSWDQHDYYYFIGSTNYAMTLERMLDLETTETQWTSSLAPQLQQAESASKQHPYALREMGIVGPLGQDGLSDTFAAALWTLNFLMFSASLNISSVQFHMTANSNASLWQPVQMYGRQPFVRPLYYGMAAFNEVMGPSCNPRVAQAEISGGSSNFRAYSVYQTGSLGSIVVINGNLANVSESSKANATVQVTLPTSLARQTVHLAYLTSEGADATANTTWNGVSFEQNGDGTATTVTDADETVNVADDGTLRFNVRDSQAVVATIGRKVGSCPDGTGVSNRTTPGNGNSDSAAASSLSSLGSVCTLVVLNFVFIAGFLII